ncbi:cytochrome c-type biogenesis protein [Pseudomonas typographi]|uniref:Cytochrome c-type biogenesis protein n=1 Tax=Pseudomonas typographi TaxID=2715964 RepID=A0ABR7Z820_9PSED|nr:cytochrome c-type biogenesis protein [Pseudomonas typographi]MBD1554205.1 cytochrome c-type biogenesis protein CcmH [Pseudomonas typographi]MBD1586689.1 cytochrome c-type biogenesis protein CcmH [Pseudomonas typographi]MBD1601685.1 cytochrome c-type biogenesis protein CcmH [Pseudomonas typographi]
MRALLAGAALALSAALAHAAIDTYTFADDTQRQRFVELTGELRCPKCQNQDIADSNAPIAADLRREIVRLLGEGKSDRQIIDYMVDRYGEFIRYRPALSLRTGLLWFGPALLLLAGAAVVAIRVRRRQAGAAQALSADEQERLARLLDEHRP